MNEISIFPEAVPAVKKLLKEVNQELEHLLERERFLNNERSSTFSLGCLVYFPRFDLQIRKNRLEKQLQLSKKRYLYTLLKPIEALKAIPITNFITFKAGFARCIWHSPDKTPSMKLYKNNTVHCFGCGRDGDVIDVVQELNHFTLKEAIRHLSTY